MRQGDDDQNMRHFLLLQGPHGPFYANLADKLRIAGHEVCRVAFNAGDCFEWGRRPGLLRYRDPPNEFPDWLKTRIAERGITDLILYGDHRWMHRAAVTTAKQVGTRLHFLEEGYLRPHWITYEREGVNGGSCLMDMTIEHVQALAGAIPDRDRPAPDQWGAMGRHLFHGLRYHQAVARGARDWPATPAARDIPLRQEGRHALRALIDLPARAQRRRWAERRLHNSGAPYHVALLQLGHDASVQAHSPYSDMTSYMKDVAAAFAQGAPAHHHLVFKLHPFEDGREGLHKVARRVAVNSGLTGRVHLLEGERLASLLDTADSVVTVNSTAAQQALWRNLPVHASGRAIFAKRGLVSQQSLRDFFADPMPPDHDAYLTFRRVLLATSQIKGGFYTRSGRATLLRGLVDQILAEEGPYAVLDRDLAATEAIILPLRRGERA